MEELGDYGKMKIDKMDDYKLGMMISAHTPCKNLLDRQIVEYCEYRKEKLNRSSAMIESSELKQGDLF